MGYKLGRAEVGEGEKWAAEVKYAYGNVYWMACLGGKRGLGVFSPCLMARKYWFPLEILLQIFQELKIKGNRCFLCLNTSTQTLLYFFNLKYVPSLVSRADNLAHGLQNPWHRRLALGRIAVTGAFAAQLRPPALFANRQLCWHAGRWASEMRLPPVFRTASLSQQLEALLLIASQPSELGKVDALALRGFF